MTDPPTTTECGDCSAVAILERIRPNHSPYVPNADYLCESCGLAQPAAYHGSGPYWDRGPGWWWLGQGASGRVTAFPIAA